MISYRLIAVLRLLALIVPLVASTAVVAQTPPGSGASSPPTSGTAGSTPGQPPAGPAEEGAEDEGSSDE
jgi:hypothetical protein